MWDAFKNWIFDVIQFFYNFCGDWGLAIIIVTVIFRLLISPLMHKQTKSSFQMQKVQPLMLAYVASDAYLYGAVPGAFRNGWPYAGFGV